MEENDQKHATELRDIELLKGTNYWFKRDIKTIKKSLTSTWRNLGYILIGSSIFSGILTYSYTQTFTLSLFFTFILVFSPLIALGYCLVYIMVHKGYNISETGTLLDASRK